VGTLTPNASTGTDQTLTATWWSQNGRDYTDLVWADLLFNTSTGQYWSSGRDSRRRRLRGLC